MSEATPTGCTMGDWDWGRPVPAILTACGEPIIAVVIFGCAHEHIDKAAACAGCAAEVQRAEGLLVCPRCEDAPNGHQCLLAYEIRWASGEVSRG